MNQRNPGRRAMRIAWAVLLVVFAAYVAVALGVGGPGVLDFFSSWVCIGLVLGAAALLALRGFASDDRRAPWLFALARRGDVGGRGAHLRDRLLRGARARALPVDRRRVLARLLLRGRHRHRARAALAAAARVPRRRCGSTPPSAPPRSPRWPRRIAFDPVLTDTAGYGWETATDLAYPLLDLGLLSLVATLLALTGWRPGLGWALFAVALVDAGDLRRPVRARDRARHRLGRHAARAAVAGGDAAARLRRLAAAEHEPCAAACRSRACSSSRPRSR